ncbi:MAG: hypothetical protein EHM12_07765 [Dehalococcoidia bacterium]|nr:MAG: hypothetical protein EHM12_07765 [Dehalococcoidia bacterium]
MIDRIKNTFAIAGLIHEIWHYLAARLLGFEARLYCERVTIICYGDSDWRELAVALAPAVVGWVGFIVVAGILWILQIYTAALFAVVPLTFWQLLLLCSDDYHQTWRQVKG